MSKDGTQPTGVLAGGRGRWGVTIRCCVSPQPSTPEDVNIAAGIVAKLIARATAIEETAVAIMLRCGVSREVIRAGIGELNRQGQSLAGCGAVLFAWREGEEGQVDIWAGASWFECPCLGQAEAAGKRTFSFHGWWARDRVMQGLSEYGTPEGGRKP
ncbi:MAG: hypothetical protein ACE5R4_02895 [Armatimonadota bacterium]